MHSYNQRRLIYNPFSTGHLNYCSLIWAFCSRSLNQLINKLQEQALRVTYSDRGPNFPELLEMYNKSAIQINNTKVLMTEIYQFLDGISIPIMNDIFQKHKNYYSLRKPRSLDSKRKFTTAYGIDTISFRGSQIWQDLP